MKICGIICEFNPFHNGHKYLLEKAKEVSGCDYLVCLMSGDFTQRGEIAIAEKYVRAKHAVMNGADCVLELQTAFAVSPAEIFAAGAIKILSSIPDVTSIAFGVENDDKAALCSAANILTTESDKFKTVLNRCLNDGKSYITSFNTAFEAVGGNAEILKKPNNILAVEYLKAIKKAKSEINIFPIKRIGADYGDEELKSNYSSAAAIRANLLSPETKQNIPICVYNDIVNSAGLDEKFGQCLKLILSRTSTLDLKRVFGCTEGLENALKSLEKEPLDVIIKGSTSKRYTASRIRRILCENFLNIYRDDCERFLSSSLYLSPLAVKKASVGGIFAAFAKASVPVLTSRSDEQKLDIIAKKCKFLDNFAHSQWQQVSGIKALTKLQIL